MDKRIQYPFTAIVGQEMMKKALVLNVINPLLGGVLIRGEKGTAKSTAVRAFEDLLPEKNLVKGCSFGCDPNNPANFCSECRRRAELEDLEFAKARMRVVDLPVSATEDRVVGTLDIEHAIKKGEKKFEAGILALANRNILYVDEVNLLDDHIIDVLLDSAAMGINTVEREGVSYSHPARFVLVGTMNPEEGDLRPQLLDRFGMLVDVVGESDLDDRVEVIKRRIAYEEDREAFVKEWEEEQEALRKRIVDAQSILGDVKCDDSMIRMAARISIELGVDGHRADISMIKTAKTIAAYKLAKEVSEEDILEAAKLVLPHRMRRRPFEETGFELDKLEEIVRGARDE